MKVRSDLVCGRFYNEDRKYDEDEAIQIMRHRKQVYLHC